MVVGKIGDSELDEMFAVGGVVWLERGVVTDWSSLLEEWCDWNGGGQTEIAERLNSPEPGRMIGLVE